MWSQLMMHRVPVIYFFLSLTWASPLAARLDHGKVNAVDKRNYGPIYNPEYWPKTLTVASDPEQRGSCSEFPEIQIGEVSFWNAPNNIIEVFCWQNHTTWGNDDFLRLVQGCYIDSSYLVPGKSEQAYNGSLPENFKELLPWCGPIRPYEIFDGNFEYETDWVDESGDVQTGQKCFLSPSLGDDYVMKGWEWTVTHCWVIGDEVNGNNTWYQKLETNVNPEKCYVPAAWLGDKLRSMEGAGGPCPWWE